MLRLTAVLVICAGLGACGMKGPLYLPEGESSAPPLDDQGIDPVTDPSRPADAEDSDRFENPEETGEGLAEDDPEADDDDLEYGGEPDPR
jgi:predicted small lipoprotein YifL